MLDQTETHTSSGAESDASGQGKVSCHGVEPSEGDMSQVRPSADNSNGVVVIRGHGLTAEQLAEFERQGYVWVDEG